LRLSKRSFVGKMRSNCRRWLRTKLLLQLRVNVDASVLVAECQKCWLTAGERNTRMKANGKSERRCNCEAELAHDVAASPLLSQLACSSGCDGLLLCCKHLGSLLIDLLHSLGSLLHSSGLRGLSGHPLLLHSLSGQCSLLLRCLLLLLQGSLNLGGLDCRLLLLELLPSLGSGLCFVPVPLPGLTTVSIPVGVPIVAASPIAAATEDHIGSVVVGAKVTWRIAIRRVERARRFWAVVRAMARRLLGAAKKQCR